MSWDLSSEVFLYSIDVRQVKTLRMQCAPGSGNPSTAVVEVKRAFGGSATDPSVSFASTVSLTLDGSAMTEIDVADTGWVHVVCTTSQSGVTVEIDHQLHGSVMGEVVAWSVDMDSTGVTDHFISAWHKAFVVAVPTETVTTGGIEIKQSIRSGFPKVAFSPAASLTIDGSTVTEIDTGTSGILLIDRTTAQSGLGVMIHAYMRDEVTADTVASGGGGIDSGSSFPGSPSDGDTYIRTDFDMPELFTYDGTRGKWLGELRMWTFGRDTANSSLLALSMGSRVIANTSRGYVTPVELTIVGAEMFNSASGLSCELNFMEGSTALTTLLTFSNDRAKYDHTLNYDIDADAADPQKYVKIENITAGAANNPMGTLYLRRRAT